MKFVNLAVILLCLFVVACSDSVTESNNDTDLTVSGTIFIDNQPIANAVVRLSTSQRFDSTVSSDDDGYFEFQDVPNGMYELSYSKNFDNGSFVERREELDVREDCRLDSLLLPDPVTMHDPVNITDETLNVSWSPTSAIDFMEYKIYRGLTSGLDETTGLLVHVSTTPTDTIFTDTELVPVETYYYRVYVMNQYGKLGGSNIVSGTTENTNYIWNGDFEDQEPLINWWNGYASGNASYCDTEVFDGNYSLFIEAEEVSNCLTPYLWGTLSRYDFPEMVLNRYYKISFWVKTEGDATASGAALWGTRPEKAGLMAYDTFGIVGIPENTDWTYCEKTFYLDETNSEWFQINICSCSTNAWFDNIKLEVADR